MSSTFGASLNALPRYLQIELDLRAKIKAKLYSDGFPTDRELCEIYSVSRMTIHHALRALEAEGIIVRQRGKRTVLKDKLTPVLRRHPDRLVLGADVDLRIQGIETRLTLLSAEEGCADEATAAALQIPVNSKCISIKRLGVSGTEPMWFEHHMMLPEIWERVRKSKEHRDGLLANVIHETVEPIAQVHLRVKAEAAGDDIGLLLSVDAAHPLLVSEYTLISANERPLDFLTLHYRSERFELEFTFDIN
jgi:GntR family transcriptional regulator